MTDKRVDAGLSFQNIADHQEDVLIDAGFSVEVAIAITDGLWLWGNFLSRMHDNGQRVKPFKLSFPSPSVPLPAAKP